jgi:hypothetical protein
MKMRYPGWVAAGALAVKVNGKPVKRRRQPGGYVSSSAHWRKGDRGRREPADDTHAGTDARQVQLLRGAARPDRAGRENQSPVQADEKLNLLADDSRMGHIAQGPVCPLEAAPMFVSDKRDFMRRFKPVKGKPLTFTAPGLIQGQGAGGLR